MTGDYNILTETRPITESNYFIVLDYYVFREQGTDYQSESVLEKELIADLERQGYEYLTTLNTPEKLLVNLRKQIQALNRVEFSDEGWSRFLEEYLDRLGDSITDKTHKIHNNHIHDFVFDDGHIQNLYLLDKKNVTRNHLQVIHQVGQRGIQPNHYDVTILVNGLPLIQIKPKKRGVAIRKAFNQTRHYSKESFNSENSLLKYLQVFVVSNGTDMRYFANTIRRNENRFDFIINWARADNTPIKDLKDFTTTLFEKNTLFRVLWAYSVFNVETILMITRFHQIVAMEQIVWRITNAYHARKWSSRAGGGFIWHTTGSDKTLTRFKAARLVIELEFIDRVFFVVGRKDLDTQTMREYQRFLPDNMNGLINMAGLSHDLEKDDNRIIVTIIQKLDNLIKSEAYLPVYDKQVVFIFDEAYRSQFGKARKNIQKKFRAYYQFGFMGTPIFKENTLGVQTTQNVFGDEQHAYVITDAIRDEKVLKFKVDYNDVRLRYRKLENE